MTGGWQLGHKLPAVWLMDLLVLPAGFFHCGVQPQQRNPRGTWVCYHPTQRYFLNTTQLFKFQNLQYTALREKAGIYCFPNALMFQNEDFSNSQLKDVPPEYFGGLPHKWRLAQSWQLHFMPLYLHLYFRDIPASNCFCTWCSRPWHAPSF